MAGPRILFPFVLIAALGAAPALADPSEQTLVLPLRSIGVSDTTIKGYFEQPSVQLCILWKIGISQSHNFFDDLISHIPIKL